jgi:phytoene dehydrogenase-like protein
VVHTAQPLRVAVIGSGIAGLVAATQIQAAGAHVTLFERARTVGGSAGHYRRGGYVFPTGATIAFGLEPDGALRALLDQLGADVQTTVLDHPMDVLLADRRLRILRDRASWLRELERVFAEDARPILRWWTRIVEPIARDILDVVRAGLALPARRPGDIAALLRLAARRPEIVAHAGPRALMTVRQSLAANRLGRAESFVRFLDAQLVDSVQTDASSAALLPACVALDVYRHGSFAVAGGLHQVSEALCRAFLGAGGSLVLNTLVTQILADHADCRVRDARGREERFTHVIDASNQALGLTRSRPQPNASAWGALRLDAVLPLSCLPPEGQQALALDHPFAWQIATSERAGQVFADPRGAVYVTAHPPSTGFGPIADHSGLVAVTVSAHTPAAAWLQLDRGSYAKRKAECAAAMLAEARRALPEWCEGMETRAYAGTPRTYARFIAKAHVGGMALTVRRAILAQPGVRTKHRRLYRCGEGVFPGPGTLSAALSGAQAARALLEDAR